MNENVNWDFLLKQFENIALQEKIDKNVLKLIIFTSSKYTDSLPFKIKKENNGYILRTKEKDYYFELLSDKDILDFDKKTLKNVKKRNTKSLLRTLRIATSNELLNQKLLLVKAKGFSLNTLVLYNRDKELWVVDYANNLIMRAYDYLELFKCRIINTLDRETLYRIYEVYDYINDIDFSYFLFAGEEMIKNIYKAFPREDDFFTDVNPLNHKIIGNDCDAIFLLEEDKKENVMDEEIDLSTLKENKKKLLHIKKDKGTYSFQKNRFSRKVEYRALSDFVDNEEIKDELLSEERYGKCHLNSIFIFLNLDDYEEGYVVGGKIAYNDKEYVYHTWIEVKIDDKWLVIDYNRNIIINKDDYYQMVKPVVINKSSKESILKLLEYEKEFKINLYSSLKVYFGEEILRDLEKNKSLIKK